MNNQSSPGIIFEDVLSLLSKLDDTALEHLVLVGGQALAFWADYYDLEELPTGMPLMSKDIDFLGDAQVADHCAKVWRGRLYIPHPFEATPNTAKVVVPLSHGETLTIDFLSYVYGLGESEKSLAKVQVQATQVKFAVLTPLFCLKSRLENLFGLGYGVHRLGQEASKLQAAIIIQYRHLLDLLQTGQTRLALKETHLLLHWAKQDRGVRACTEYGIDLLEAVPQNHSGYGEQFWKLDYPKKEAKILAKRNRFLK